MNDFKTTALAVARQCIDRVEAQGSRGKRRDADALEFYCGAVAGLVALGQTDMATSLCAHAFLVSCRGYSEVAAIRDLMSGEG